MPPGITTAIFGCAGSFETVIANIFEACDFSQPLIAFIDDQGKFTATVDEPVPTSPDGTCLIVDKIDESLLYFLLFIWYKSPNDFPL